MKAIKGGKVDPRRVQRRRNNEPDGDTKRTTNDIEEPSVIKVKVRGAITTVVPNSVWRQPPFPWRPHAFGLESDRLSDAKIIEPEVQSQSLAMFTAEPDLPLIYSISGNPADTKAKYFAAYLLDIHMRTLGIKANPMWYPIYEGYANPIMVSGDEPSIIVITNLTLNATNQKLSKARDVLEKFDHIPRLVVSAGCDPLSFAASKLFCEVNAMAYFPEGIVKQKVEII